MPWTCQLCGTRIESDDPSCPSCEKQKTSWTLVVDATREFRVVGGKRVQYLRGEATEPRTAGSAEPQEPLIKAERAWALPRSYLRQLSEAGLEPAPRDVLTVRLFPGTGTDWTVNMAIEFEADEVEERTFPAEAPAGFDAKDGADRRFVLVFGEDDALDEEPFAGITLVDVSEDTPDGFAPSIEVSALKKKARTLPISAGWADWYLSAVFHDWAGRVRLAGKSLTVEGRTATTDADGAVVVEGMPPGDLEVTIEGGTAVVSATHHQDVKTRVFLRFVDGDAVPDEPAQASDEEQEHAEVQEPYVPPRWYPWLEEDDADGESEDDHFLSAVFLDWSGQQPIAHRRFTVGAREGHTNARGVAVLDDLPPGDLEVAFDDGVVRVPAAHHPGVLTRVFLRFVPGDEPPEAEAAIAEDDPPGEAFALPPWYPTVAGDGT